MFALTRPCFSTLHKMSPRKNTPHFSREPRHHPSNSRLFYFFLRVIEVTMANTRRLSSAILILLLVALCTQVNGATIKPTIKSTKRKHNVSKQHAEGGVTDRPLTSVTSKSPTSPQPNLYDNYLDWIDRQPVVAKSVTAMVVLWIGDLLSQRVEAHVAKAAFALNWTRSRAFAVCGLLWVGPYVHNWYEILWALGRYMEQQGATNKNLQIFSQVVMDQTVGVCIYFPLYFYAYEMCWALVSLKGKVPSKKIESLRMHLTM